MTLKSQEYTLALQPLGVISGDDFKSWKSLCQKSGNIRATALESVDNPLDLIELLEQRNLVNEDNVSMLVKTMKALGRIEFSENLLEYEKKWALTEVTQTTEYNRLLTKINGALVAEELAQVKFLCRTHAGFTKDKRSKMTSCLEVFTGLEQLLLLDKNEITILKDLLKQIERLDLVKAVETYEQKYITGPRGSHQSNLIDLSEEFDVIVKYIGRNWRHLARRLKVTEADIDFIVDKHRNNLREQLRESLKIWQENNRDGATREVLISTLRKCEFNYVADVIEKKIIE